METLAWFLLLSTATCLLAAYTIWFYRLSAVLSGPHVWPIIGSLPGLLLNAHRMHDWISDNLCRTGGTYQTCICAVPFLARRQGLVTVTCDPRNLEHILKTRFNNYPKGPTWHAVFHDLLGDGIFNSDGDSWRLQRKTAAPEFTTRTLRLAMSRCLSNSIHLRLLPILNNAAAVSNGAVDLQDLLLRLTFDNICSLIFGHDPETLSADLPVNFFASSFDAATEATLRRLILPEVIWKFMKRFQLHTEASLSNSVAGVQHYLSSMIKARRIDQSSGNSDGDLISRFIAKGSYSDEFLIHVALNFILAGRDTSSVALSWFFWLLSTHPETEETILAELCSVLAESRGRDQKQWLIAPLSFEELDKLVYLKAALSETLRLYPPVPEDTKYAAADDVLPDGTFVPAGSSVTYSIYSVGRMERVWGEDWMEFRPERWLSGGRYEAPADSFKFVAFNAGPRVCLGKELAYLQMKTIAASVLLRYRFRVVAGHRIEQKMSLTLFMKYGLPVHVQHADLSKFILETVSDQRH